MMLPILISVSDAPGSYRFCARAWPAQAMLSAAASEIVRGRKAGIPGWSSYSSREALMACASTKIPGDVSARGTFCVAERWWRFLRPDCGRVGALLIHAYQLAQ